MRNIMKGSIVAMNEVPLRDGYAKPPPQAVCYGDEDSCTIDTKHSFDGTHRSGDVSAHSSHTSTTSAHIAHFSLLSFIFNQVQFPIELHGSDTPIDVVWDLDGTLIYLDINLPVEYKTMLSGIYGNEHIDVAKPPVNPKQATMNLRYSLAYGTYEVLHCLMQYPYIRMSFYSAGEKWRNEQVVPKLFAQLQTRFARLHHRQQTIASAHTVTSLPPLDLKHNSTAASSPRELSPRQHKPSRRHKQSFFGSLSHAFTYLFVSSIDEHHTVKHRVASTASAYQIISKSSMVNGHKDLCLVEASQLPRTILVDDKMRPIEGQERNLLRVVPGLGDYHPYRNEVEEMKIHCNLIRALGMIILSVYLSQHFPMGWSRFINLASESSPGAAEIADNDDEHYRTMTMVDYLHLLQQHPSEEHQQLFVQIGMTEIQKLYPNFHYPSTANWNL